MRITAFFAATLLVAGGSLQAQQRPPVGQLPATTVQLPSFSIFSVNTAVSVPDGGGAYLGGIKRGRDSSTTRGFGPLANRGLGSDRNAGGVTVHAQIQDLNELDKAVLAEAAARRGAIDPDLAKAELIRRGVAQGNAEAEHHDIGVASVAVIRAKNTAAKEAREKEAADLLARAEAAQTAGKPSVARIYYQMAARRSEGELKALAESRLATLDRQRIAAAK